MSKRLLFVGVSSMRQHAGQQKLYFLADAFGLQGAPVTVLVPDLEENRAFFEGKSHVETRFYTEGHAIADAWQKSRVAQEDRWSAIWLVGVGLRSFLMTRSTPGLAPIIKDFDEFPSMIESIGPLRRTYLRWIERLMVRQAQGFTCASAFLEHVVRLRRPGIGDRLLRLPVAISEDEHQVDPDLVQRLRQAAAGRPILLYVGSVDRIYEDQLDEIIRLAVVFCRRGLQAQIRIAGDGPDMEYFKARAAAAHVMGNLEFVGHVRRHTELASHMEAAQVLLFPFPASLFNLSRCPTKAFHYAAANRPVVTNETGEVAALLRDSAFYYPEHDIEAFADRCVDAMRCRHGFDSGIQFSALTWKARAREFLAWLELHGWLSGTACPRAAG